MAEESDADDGTGDGQPVDGDSGDSDADVRVESDGGGTDAENPADAGDTPADDSVAGNTEDGDADADGAPADASEDDRPVGADESEPADGKEGESADADDESADDGTTAGSTDPIGAVTDADDTPARSAREVALGEPADAGTTDDDAAPGEGTDPDEGSASGVDDDADGGDSDAGDADTDAASDDAVDTDDGGETVTHYDASAAREAGEWGSELAEDADEYEEALADDPTAPPAEAADATDAVGPTAETVAAGDTTAQGPPDDQEMPLADHVEEMVLRLAVVCGVATVVAGTVFFFEPLAETMILFIWESVIPSPDVADVPSQVGGTAWPGHYVSTNVAPSNPRVYGPLELKLTELKFASLVGFVVALPVFVYETYRFMRPGLYPHERRYYLAAVPTSLVLAFVGVSFAYFIILPAIFAYFVRYSERAGLLAFALRQTFDLILVLMGYMALVFQIPLFIMLAIMMGLTDRQWLQDRRLYFWGGFLGVSFLFVPEPTGMAPILVALTMIGLFEGTLALLRWTGN